MEYDFEKLMSNKSDEGLQEYLNNRAKYTPKAVEAALAELQKRGLTFTEEKLNSVKEELQQRKEFIPEWQQRKTSIYWWGLLGLIPILGVIVGTILIVIGVVRIKDKILVFIGVCCILFTVAIYALMFLSMGNMLNSPEADKGFAQITQMEINSFVKNVEFYKMQNGSYPDNLEQLQADDKTISIVDPMLLRKTTEGNLNYHYLKVGNKYNLHSVGIDGLDKTADDIYPTLANTDSTKIGFIRK